MIDWSPLRLELAIWKRESFALPLWWRDDDAVNETAELDQLLELADKLSLPVHVAVIPRDATTSLALRCQSTEWAVPLVHGWAHENHAAQGQKKAEFNTLRSDATQDLGAALAQMTRIFGEGFVPIFVPPWNRIHPEYVQKLTHLGYSGLSTFTPRTSRFAAPGLVQINTHIDPINWRGSRSLTDPEMLITQLVDLLKDRRNGHTDMEEPLGFLTHHLVHDPAIWNFTEACLSELLNAGATSCNLMSLKGNLP